MSLDKTKFGHEKEVASEKYQRYVLILKNICDSSLSKHQAHGLHAEYKTTLIKSERVIQYWFNRFQRVQIYPNCVCAALLLLPFGENVQIHQSGGACRVIMTMILSVNSMIILKTDHEISRNKVFLLRLNFIIERIKLKEHRKSIDIALVNCFTNLVKSQLCLGF